MKAITILVAVSVLVAALAGVGWIAFNTSQQLKLVAAQDKELQAQLSSKATRETFELQQRCSELAEKYFQATRKAESIAQGTIFDYQSHYNAQQTNA